VPVEKSRAEIESLVIKHGATGFMNAWQDRTAIVQFRLNSRMLRYAVENPEPKEFKRAGLPPNGRKVNGDEKCNALAAAEHRRRWRALLLILRAKLEIVASGDSTFDHEFLADIMLPEGGTVGQQLVPQIEQAYLTGAMPKLLGPG
jgi:hypothetical protein